MKQITPISAELVAEKLEQIANFQQPKLHAEFAVQPQLKEILWFLQFVSQPDNYAGDWRDSVKSLSMPPALKWAPQ